MAVTIDSLADALKYASGMIQNTKNNVEMVLNYLKEYDYVETVTMFPPSGTEITCFEVNASNIPTDKIFQDLSLEFWSKYFIPANNVFSSMYYIKLKTPVNKNNSLMFKELLDDESILNSSKIKASQLLYDDSVVFTDSDKNERTFVAPYSILSDYFYLKSEPIVIDDLSSWTLLLKLNTITISGNKNKISIDNIKAEESVLVVSKDSSFPYGQVNLDELQESYLALDGVLDKKVKIPETAKHNMVLIGDILNSDYKKLNDSIVMEMPVEQDYNILKNSLDNFFANGAVEDTYIDENYFIQKRNLSASISYLLGKYTS